MQLFSTTINSKSADFQSILWSSASSVRSSFWPITALITRPHSLFKGSLPIMGRATITFIIKWWYLIFKKIPCLQIKKISQAKLSFEFEIWENCNNIFHNFMLIKITVNISKCKSIQTIFRHGWSQIWLQIFEGWKRSFSSNRWYWKSSKYVVFSY